MREQKAAPIAEIGVVVSELVAVIAHGERRRLIVRQWREPGEMTAPLFIGERLQPHRCGGAVIAEADVGARKVRGTYRVGELRPQRGEAGIGAVGGGKRHPRQMDRRRATDKPVSLPARRLAMLPPDMARRLTLDFLRTEAGAGMAPVAAGAVALILANSPLSGRYFALLAHPIAVQVGSFHETFPLESWVKNGLMALFFLVVGMEIKFELLRGELSSPRRLALPVLAALGGMIAPALIYLLVNLGGAGAPHGWPIATATDVAFALAALAVVAPRMPPSLRVFLLTLAIADDLGAVALIGLLYTSTIYWTALLGAGAGLAALAMLSRWKKAPLLFYSVGFLLVWGFCLKSGVNTSVAGVACALTVPIGARRAGGDGVLKMFMDSLHPYVAFGVLPLFAFVAAGFPLSGLTANDVLSPIPLGLALALVIGKPLGVFGFAFLGSTLRLGRRPTGTTWLEMFGVALLCGLGFTMSLYLGGLAFGGGPGLAQSQVRLGVITGSLASVVAGGAVMALARRRREAQGDEPFD